MNWQDLLSSLNASDDPQADIASKGWGKVLDKAFDNSPPAEQFADPRKQEPTLQLPAIDPIDLVAGAGAGRIGSALGKDAQSILGNEIGTIGKGSGLTPNEKIRELAQEYMKAKKIPTLPDQPYAKVDPGIAKKIAQAYEEMKHDPENPQVKAAYRALIDETNAQFQKLKESGLRIDKITGENPYKSSADLLKDIKDNNHISYYPTENGFGTNTSTSNHPMLAKSGETINGEEVPANDIFRIVHDYFGHAKEGPGFGPRGEENAFREHAQMYSPEALKALATETRGQNSWVNFGPKGEANRANPANTVFADQKAGLLPEWASEFNKTMETLKPQSKLPKDITFKHTPGDNIHNVQAIDANGNIVGEAEFAKTSGGYYPTTVEVDPDMQRKGIASEMYRLQEEKSGSKVIPSSEQSDEAAALWRNPNRPFGPQGDMEELQKLAERARIEAANRKSMQYLDEHPEYKAKLMSDLEQATKNDADRYITKSSESIDEYGNRSTSYTHEPNPNWKPQQHKAKPETNSVTLSKQDLLDLGYDEASAEEEYAKQFSDKFSSLKKKLGR